ncbi:MAG: FAD-binding protein, partial [Symbiobacteriaceae bacterium]|nr:FAD-binding protein [Symbiobacteriaceae bacterium]
MWNDTVRRRIIANLDTIYYEENAPMTERTTFKVGGPADLLVEPASPEELILLNHLATATGAPLTVIGGGSNLVVKDGGIRGLVMVIGPRLASWEDQGGGIILATAGIRLTELSSVAAKMGLAGLESAAGIPGTLGGAVTMNAGAYGGE